MFRGRLLLLVILLHCGGCQHSPTPVNSSTICARSVLTGIPFVAQDVRGKLLYDDPAVAVQIRQVAFDGKRVMDSHAESYPHMVWTNSIETSCCRVYMLRTEVDNNGIVFKCTVESPDGSLEWREVRAPAQVARAEITFAIRYPDGKTSEEGHARIVLPPMWHY
jgi:hypothetical protein